MFYTLIKHGFLTNQSARRVLSILQSHLNHSLKTQGSDLPFLQKRMVAIAYKQAIIC